MREKIGNELTRVLATNMLAKLEDNISKKGLKSHVSQLPLTTEYIYQVHIFKYTYTPSVPPKSSMT